MATIKGTAGNDTLTGTNQSDNFYLAQGGTDTVSGKGGDDQFFFRAAFTAADTVNGGTGFDEIELNGDYNLTLAATTITSVEEFFLWPGHNYSITSVDANVGAGKTLKILGSKLGAGDSVTFDGSAETNGRFDFVGGAGNDTFIGGSGNDVFHLQHGGSDTAKGNAGNDTFQMGAGLNAADNIIGGAGQDVVYLAGNYSGAKALTMTSTTLTGVEKLVVRGKFNYNITTADATVAAGKTMVVHANTLNASHSLTFDASAETDAAFNITGGRGNDTITMSNDEVFIASKINGGSGNDTLNLYGDFSSTAVFAQVTNIDRVNFGPGHDQYAVTFDNTVAAGATMIFDYSQVGPANNSGFDGHLETDGNFHIIDGQGTNNLIGGGGNDRFDLLNGSSDNASGGNGDDTFNFAGNFVAANESIDGGGGNNTLTLDGGYAGLTLNATPLANIQNITVFGGHNYNLTMAQNFTGGAGPLTFTATDLHAANTLTADATDVSVETVWNLDKGTYTVTGSASFNTFNVGADFKAADTIRGGEGADVMNLNGDYSGGLTLGATTISGIETIAFVAGNSYDITTNDLNFAGGPVTIDASALGTTDHLTFDGSAESTANFTIKSGSGSDSLTGGAGADTFRYDDGITLSNGTRDTIHDFNFTNDKIAFATVTGVDNVNAGSVSSATFGADIAAIFGSGGSNPLGANHAVLFDPSAGTLSGQDFLLVDKDGVAGYTPGTDLIIQLDAPLNTGSLATGNFVA